MRKYRLFIVKQTLWKGYYMKKLFVFLTLGVIMSGICFAETARNENRIIGTWLVNSASGEYLWGTWVFNSNGILLIGNYSFEYGITETKLFIKNPKEGGYNMIGVHSYSISSDGKTLILERFYWKDSGASTGVWLIKK
jgi:hypothetical protein